MRACVKFVVQPVFRVCYNMVMGEREYITITEAAALLGVSRSHVYALEKRGKLHIERNPLYDPHGRVRVKLADVLALLPAPDRAAALERLR